MRKTREIVIDAGDIEKYKQQTLDKAKILISIAVYFIIAGTLMEHVSLPVMLKSLGFMMTAHAFYFLWKSARTGH